ncbi:MAG: M20/M25/M40 family metallo-hydrolase [Ktedonobacteraceae bacterium]|nr:M20/M25/M40 family metallo-hydrolase [Ktedonobacteraceae bacterium]MBO0790691.1 M20/M25/M40 family metallo-hydrolase [Ktedonobacteraceae bacterium]
MPFERLRDTLIEIIRLPSTSGHEEQVRAYLQQQLTELDLPSQVDETGNLISTLPGKGAALLLNAHMDRVPPGLGHEPVLRDGILYSDGTTNLGADDAAGIAIILETLRQVNERRLPHPPLVIVFTVQEETGLCGARTFKSATLNVRDGIVFDNAYEAGVVVSAGAAYEAFDVQISGRTGHPGKDLAQTVHAIEIFHSARYPHGSLNNDQTRINIGRISGGSARNAIPDTLHIEGELRSFESAEQRQSYMEAIRSAFSEAALRVGGQAEIRFTTHATGYAVEPHEPLLQTYSQVLQQRGATLQMRPTFIGSDTSGFRPSIRAFTVSTGAANEHSIAEYIPLAPLEQLVEDTLQVMRAWTRE